MFCFSLIIAASAEFFKAILGEGRGALLARKDGEKSAGRGYKSEFFRIIMRFR
jgi:hypothetical protein